MTTAVNPADATDATAAAAAAATAAALQTDAQAAIPVLREQIDALDAAIIRLVAERARVSRRIQTARINAGGTRVELGRERIVHATYRDGLGPDGPQLADSLLQVCRGQR